MKFNFPALNSNKALKFLNNLSADCRVRIIKKLELYERYDVAHLLRSQIVEKLGEGLFEVHVLGRYRFLGTITRDTFLYILALLRKRKRPQGVSSSSRGQ